MICKENIFFRKMLIVADLASLSGHSKTGPKIGFQDQLWLNASQKYCRMLQREHSAILSTFTKLPFAVKNFVI